MRVALLGNLCNTAYVFAKALRGQGVEAEVFIDEKECGQIAGYPEWEDPDIDSRKVPWIHHYRQRHPVSLFGVFRRLREYDVVHAFGMPNVYCQFVGRPWIAHALGADLKEVVYERGPAGWLLNRAFGKANRVLFSDLDHLPHVRRKGFDDADYFPAAVDVDRYAPEARPIEGPLVFFHAAFLDWTRAQPTSKRNDRFLRAFSRVARQRDDFRLRLILAGPDVEPTQRLIAELDLEERVEYLPPLNKQQLIDHYRACDLIVDQFGMPKFGVNALEGMACGKPVLLNLNLESAATCYSSLPPVLAAADEDHIAAALEGIRDRRHLAQLGADCRNWVVANHDSSDVARRLAGIYETCLGASERSTPPPLRQCPDNVLKCDHV